MSTAAKVAVVLGAGGSVGHAFHAGVLSTLADDLGWDARRADVLVGTSAGSIVCAMLRSGVPASDLGRRARGVPLSPDGTAIFRRAGIGARPTGSPQFKPPAARRMASAGGVLRGLAAPWTTSVGSLAAAVLPAGTVSNEMIETLVDGVAGSSWPVMTTWIVTVDVDRGRRVVFGRDAVTSTLGRAVRASCAIPAFFEPVEINGARYVDGGVHSTTNADLVADERPDLVIVSAPMSATRAALRSRNRIPIRVAARWSLTREVARLRRKGIKVVTFQPSPDDIDAMGANALDASKMASVCEQVQATTARRLRADALRAELDVLTTR